MEFGLWTPLPRTLRPEPRMEEAVGQAKQSGQFPYADQPYAMAKDTILEAERLGFRLTLLAQRYRGADLDEWTPASALAAGGKA